MCGGLAADVTDRKLTVSSGEEGLTGERNPIRELSSGEHRLTGRQHAILFPAPANLPLVGDQA